MVDPTHRLATVVIVLLILSCRLVQADVQHTAVTISGNDRLNAILKGAPEVKHYLNLENRAAEVLLDARKEGDTVFFTFTTPSYVRSYQIKGPDVLNLIAYLQAYEEVLAADDPLAEARRRFPSLEGIVYPRTCAQMGSSITLVTWKRDTITGTLMAIGTNALVMSSHQGGIRSTDTLVVVPYADVRLVSDKQHQDELLYLGTPKSNAEQVVNAIAAYLDARPVYERCVPPEVRTLIEQPYPYDLDQLSPDPSLSSPMYAVRLSVLGQLGAGFGDFSNSVHDSIVGSSDYYSRNFKFNESTQTAIVGGMIAGTFAISHIFDISLRAGLSHYSSGNLSANDYTIEATNYSGRVLLCHSFGRPDYTGFLDGGTTIGIGGGLQYSTAEANAFIDQPTPPFGVKEPYGLTFTFESQSLHPLLNVLVREQIRLGERLFVVGEVNCEYFWTTTITDEVRYTNGIQEHVTSTSYIIPTQFSITIGFGLEYAF